tara:strand:- start:151543 stop:153915 length:2373 start_codon:yes stop_codon:yes gene_type:complete
MSLINSTIPNLINGVSQQSDELRQPSQCALQENAYSSIVEGLKMRPSTRHRAKIMDGHVGSAYVHLINRDVNERYKVIITDGQIRVFDLEGNQKTVTVPSPDTYLGSSLAEEDFRCVTIADYTFVLNTSVTVKMDEELSPDRGVEAIVFVNQANYETDYKITIDGSEVASRTTTASEALKTTKIAEDLATALNTNLDDTWELQREGPVIHIRKTDKSDFEIKVEDSRSNQNISVFKERVQRFSELPTIAPAGFTLEVIGEQFSNFDNYFVKFTPNNEGATFDYGLWEETVKPSIPWKFKATTMPHALIRQADGTFSFETIEWGEREVGDEDSAPAPTFVGRKINDVYFYENRLGMLSDGNAILSRATEFFEFFPSTVTTLVDSDPIDIASSTNKVSILRHAVPFNEELIFFSDQAQFKLVSGDVLSSETAKIKTMTEFESSLKAKPTGVGKTVFFVIEKGQYAGIREIYVDGDTQSSDVAEITSHVPQYIPAGAFKIAAASNEEIVFVLTRGERNAIYTYKYYWQGSEKLQSAWSKYILGDNNTSILNAEFINTDCYLVVQYPDGVYLEMLSVEPGRVDPYANFECRLDRRVDETQCLSISYDEDTGSTTYQLPYQLHGQAVAFTRYSADMSFYTPGVVLNVLSQGTDTVTVEGKHDDVPVYIGRPFTMRYRFSEQTVKAGTATTGVYPVNTGRLQMRYWSVTFDNSGYFRIEVKPHWKAQAYVYKFTGKILGSRSATIGRVGLSSGRKTFPVHSKSDRVDVDLVNDSCLPCCFLSANWEATYISRARRV